MGKRQPIREGNLIAHLSVGHYMTLREKKIYKLVFHQKFICKPRWFAT